ncbi:hypothetical protein C7B65_07710 [Phormidesmis priestleyi ULC007]|uniref:Uncharacterized protein n=1 Tax=Phormidesmis priestleyi ULC007 TaxID=1920490 RepID=A0A2T1DIM4_9CYAN|nr:hypothetical protein [Phormidesmis priestleyi]PSB20323.1 hypothetical protein C7B65_07710 [Phormidesmis priestleyi ULC007]PZO50192.1 MAG: hypothetical protein DCF14_12340 [Phormidesmis priestleyi]
MNLPPQLPQKVEKWSNLQGIKPEQFIMEAIAEKVNRLDRQVDEQNSDQPKTYYEGNVLVVDAELPPGFDLNAFIDELREERIQEQMFDEGSRVLLQQAGALADDESLAELRRVRPPSDTLEKTDYLLLHKGFECL